MPLPVSVCRSVWDLGLDVFCRTFARSAERRFCSSMCKGRTFGSGPFRIFFASGCCGMIGGCVRGRATDLCSGGNLRRMGVPVRAPGPYLQDRAFRERSCGGGTRAICVAEFGRTCDRQSHSIEVLLSGPHMPLPALCCVARVETVPGGSLCDASGAGPENNSGFASFIH